MPGRSTGAAATFRWKVAYPHFLDFAGQNQGALAQLGERLICIQEVIGSIPIGSTTSRSRANATRGIGAWQAIVLCTPRDERIIEQALRLLDRPFGRLRTSVRVDIVYRERNIGFVWRFRVRKSPVTARDTHETVQVKYTNRRHLRVPNLPRILAWDEASVRSF